MRLVLALFFISVLSSCTLMQPRSAEGNSAAGDCTFLWGEPDELVREPVPSVLFGTYESAALRRYGDQTLTLGDSSTAVESFSMCRHSRCEGSQSRSGLWSVDGNAVVLTMTGEPERRYLVSREDDEHHLIPIRQSEGGCGQVWEPLTPVP